MCFFAYAAAVVDQELSRITGIPLVYYASRVYDCGCTFPEIPGSLVAGERIICMDCDRRNKELQEEHKEQEKAKQAKVDNWKAYGKREVDEDGISRYACGCVVGVDNVIERACARHAV